MHLLVNTSVIVQMYCIGRFQCITDRITHGKLNKTWFKLPQRKRQSNIIDNYSSFQTLTKLTSIEDELKDVKTMVCDSIKCVYTEILLALFCEIQMFCFKFSNIDSNT